MPPAWPIPVEGGCACGELRYRLDKTPMFIHCCNCHRCQRETGSAFALNAIVETDALTLLPQIERMNTEDQWCSNEPAKDKPSTKSENDNAKPVHPKQIVLPSDSGFGQLHIKCPRCYTTVWSYYAGTGPYSAFVKCGTLDKINPSGQSLDEVLKPDIYIYTKFKQPWFACRMIRKPKRWMNSMTSMVIGRRMRLRDSKLCWRRARLGGKEGVSGMMLEMMLMI